MIITESFVWINFPKTASTFVRECLRELYTIPWWNLAKKRRFKGRWMKEIDVRNIRSKNPSRAGKPTPHGMLRQIPPEFSHLPVVTALRCPAERLVSLFNYGDWKKNEAIPFSLEEIKLHFPSFPNLSFEMFIEYLKFYYLNCKLIVGNNLVSIGPQSWDLLDFFYTETNHDPNILNFNSFKEIEALFSNVTILGSEKINKSLHHFLHEQQHYQRDIQFILDKKKVNVSSNICSYQNNDYQKKILNDEYLFDMIFRNNGKISMDFTSVRL